MGTWEQGGGGPGEAENREILIRAKVDFMFNRGERKILGASGKKHRIFWDSEKSWEQSRGGGPSCQPKLARKNHQCVLVVRVASACVSTVCVSLTE